MHHNRIRPFADYDLFAMKLKTLKLKTKFSKIVSQIFHELFFRFETFKYPCCRQI